MRAALARAGLAPDEIDYVIPGNDDALRAIRLIANTISQAYLDGKAVFEAQQKELAEQMEKQRQLQAQQAAAQREAAQPGHLRARDHDGKRRPDAPRELTVDMGVEPSVVVARMHPDARRQRLTMSTM